VRYYTSSRRDAVRLDVRAADLDSAPARLRKGATIKRDRALMIVNGKDVEGACALLQHVVVDVRDEDADQAPVLVVEDVA
jgi:hypothetical protein